MKKETTVWEPSEPADPHASPNRPAPRSIRRWRWLDQFFSLETPDYAETRVYAPPYDVTETSRSYWMNIDLPGVSREDIRVELLGNELVVSGTRRGSVGDRPLLPSRSKPRYGRFKRSFALPLTVDTEAIQAGYRDGVLTLALPKRVGLHGREIPISDDFDHSLRFELATEPSVVPGDIPPGPKEGEGEREERAA